MSVIYNVVYHWQVNPRVQAHSSPTPALCWELWSTADTVQTRSSTCHHPCRWTVQVTSAAELCCRHSAVLKVSLLCLLFISQLTNWKRIFTYLLVILFRHNSDSNILLTRNRMCCISAVVIDTAMICLLVMSKLCKLRPPKKVGCFYIRLSFRLLRKLWTDFDKIFGGAKEQSFGGDPDHDSDPGIFKPPPPVGAGGGYMFSGRPSVPLSVHPSIRPWFPW